MKEFNLNLNPMEKKALPALLSLNGKKYIYFSFSLLTLLLCIAPELELLPSSVLHLLCGVGQKLYIYLRVFIVNWRIAILNLYVKL